MNEKHGESLKLLVLVVQWNVWRLC